MANNPVDPVPLVPRGFVLCYRSQEEDTPQRVFTFLSMSVRCINEDIAIAILEPVVDPIDYPQVANTIHSFLVNTLCLKNIHTGPSALGAATVTFDSCLDRQVAIGAPHRMGPYWLSFIPHDARANLHHLPLDRTYWIMLVNFPIDCLSEACIAASLNCFGNLLLWHESSNKARQIVLVNLYSSTHIPLSVVVSVGDGPFARCWSVACYLLNEAQVPLPIDTDPLPPNGRTPHPLPQLPCVSWEMVLLASLGVAMATSRRVRVPVFTPKRSPWPRMCQAIAMWYNQPWRTL
jgi:hypothetical protein